MKTLDEVVNTLRAFNTYPTSYHNNYHESGVVNSTYSLATQIALVDIMINDALKYLEDYQKIQRQIFPVESSQTIDYCGRHPIIKIDDEYYLVRRYLPLEDHWLLEKMKWSTLIEGCWFNCDDFDYIFDKYGKLVRREG